METTTDIVVSGLLTSTKALRQEIAMQIVHEVAEGDRDALKSYIEVKKSIDLLEQVEKNLRPMIAGKGFSKSLTMYDTEFTEKKDPDKIDYESSGDSEYLELCRSLAELKQKIKDREAFLKAVKNPVAVTEGKYAGEIINPCQVIYGKQNFSCSLK